MSSLTLQKLGIDVNYICSYCNNAIWQEIKKTYSNNNDYDLFDFESKDIKDKYKLCCWCTLLHTYIVTPRKNCDGFPDPDFNNFVDKNK